MYTEKKNFCTHPEKERERERKRELITNQAKGKGHSMLALQINFVYQHAMNDAVFISGGGEREKTMNTDEIVNPKIATLFCDMFCLLLLLLKEMYARERE